MRQCNSLTSTLLILSLVFSAPLLAQQHFSDTLQAKTANINTFLQPVRLYADSLYKIYASDSMNGALKLMPFPVFDKFINKYFSYVSTSKAGLPDGNSVSLQTTSNSTILQANLSYKHKGTIFNAGLQADYANNIANLFSGNDVTGNTSFYTNLSFLTLGTRNVKYNANLARNNNDAKKIRIRQFISDLEAKYVVSYYKDSGAYHQAIRDYDSVSDVQRLYQVDSNVSKLLQMRQAIFVAGAKLKAYGLNERSELYDLNDLSEDMTTQLTDSISIIMDTIEINNTSWEIFRFGWFSAGLTYTQQTFKTYDSMLAFPNRINDLTFNNVGLTLSYNYIFQSSAEYAKRNPESRVQSWYLSGAYTLGNDLNYANFDTTQVLTIHQIPGGGDSVYQFQAQNKVRDISGVAKKISWNHTFSIQSTLALTKSNFMGLTTALTTKISPFASPVYSGTLGFLFRFINSDSQQSRINFQLFLQLNDWRDSKGTDKSTWQRKVIGFNATIPFSNLFF